MSLLKRGIKAYFNHYSGLPLICWNGIAIEGLMSVVTGLIFFISIYLTTALKLNITVAGTIVSCYGIGNVVGGIAGGKLCDRYSPNLVSLGCAFLQSICFIILPHLTAIHFLMITLLVMGICSYGFITSISVWILNHCKHQETLRLKAINIMATVSNLGIGSSALLIAFMYKSGFPLIFNVASVLLVGAVIYLLKLQWWSRKNNLPSTTLLRTEPQREGSESKPILPVKPNYKIIYLILSCVFGIGLIIAQRRTTYPIYLHTLFPGTGIKAVSILLALNPALIVLLQTPLVGAVGRFNKIMLVGAGAFLMGFGMLLLSFAVFYSLAILACVVYTIGEMLFFSSAQLVCYESGAPKKKGHSLGIYKTVYAASTIVGPTLGGFIYHYFGGNMVWYCCGLIGVLCFVSCVWQKKVDYNGRPAIA